MVNLHEAGACAVLDREALDQLLALDDEGAAFVEIVESFLRDARKLLQSIAEAIEQKNAKLLERSAHTLKSTSATVGAAALAAICKELELAARAGESSAPPGALAKLGAEFAAAAAALAAELAKYQK